MGERWLAITDYEGVYEISDQGRVRRLTFRNRMGWYQYKTPHILKASGKAGPYRQVCLSRDGRSISRMIHLLVLEKFVGPCPPGREAAHRNGKAKDNRLSNLRWATKEENEADKVAHGTARSVGAANPNAKLTESDVRKIRELRSRGWRLSTIGEHFGVRDTTVGDICKRRRWAHVV